jgi:hypothetical protein
MVAVLGSFEALPCYIHTYIHPHEAEWTPFQTHYFSENLVAQGIEPRSSGSVARNSDLLAVIHQFTRRTIKLAVEIIVVYH